MIILLSARLPPQQSQEPIPPRARPEATHSPEPSSRSGVAYPTIIDLDGMEELRKVSADSFLL